MKKQEYILCAAIHIKKDILIIPKSTIKNIDKGIIISARRHSDCFNILEAINGSLDRFNANDLKPHGFLTSHNRFVLRDEAFIIAQKNKQFLNPLYNTIDPTGMQLISEHIY